MVSEAERAAVQKRILLKETAAARGRPFTRTEAIRFLGGGTQVALLRSARRKGLTTSVLEEEQKKALEEPITKTPTKPLTPTELRARGRVDISPKPEQKLFLKQEQTDIFIPKGTRKIIPITKVFVTDESGIRIREASLEETQEFQKGTRVLKVPETKKIPIAFEIGEKTGALSKKIENILKDRPVLTKTKNILFNPLTTGKEFETLPLEKKQDLLRLEQAQNIQAAIFLATLPGLPKLKVTDKTRGLLGKPEVDLTKTLKDSSLRFLRDKRGQVSILVKKKKKKKGDIRAEDVGQLTEEEIEASSRARDTVSNIENKLANSKTSQEQLRILDNIRKELKNPLAKENFKKFIRQLQEKKILITERVEVAQGVFVDVPKGLVKKRVIKKPSPVLPTIKQRSLIGIPRSVGGEGLTEEQLSRVRGFPGTKQFVQEFEVVVPLSRQKEISRVKTAQDINQARINVVRERTELNQRKNQLMISAQQEKEKLRQLQSLRLDQRVDSQQISRQIEAQKERLGQATASLFRFNQQSRQRSKQIGLQFKRIGERARPRIPKKPKRFKFPIPFPGLKGKPKKKKVIRLIKPIKKITPFIKQKPSRENKFKAIGKGTTLPKAKNRLLKELGSSLRASGFLRNKKGKSVRPKSLPKEFRFSKNKRTPNLIVERRKFRLDSPQEKASIRKAKSNLKSTKMIKLKKKR